MVDFALTPLQSWGAVIFIGCWTIAAVFIGVRLGRFIDD